MCHAPFLTYFHDDYHLPRFPHYLQSFADINISIAMKRIIEIVNILSLIDF